MAGLFSPSTLERIRAANEIVEVIGSYVPLKRAGGAFVGLCPFHREKTPSFHVNPQRQTFHCFGCHKGGDVFTFLKEFENLDFPEAVRRLAERAKIPLEYQDGAEPPQSRQLKDQLLQIHEQLAQRWHNALLNEASGQAARDYLDSRHVPLEAVTLFRLGAAPEAWDDTVNWARSREFDLAIVEKAGLIIRKEGTDRYYDRFRGRLMFPICDEQGRVIGFSGRVLAADVKAAKYVNSPETPIFTKSKVFFGLDKAKRAVLDAGHAVVCEGQLDLITCHMAGVQNVVAPQGTAFTGDHARILKRYVEEVVLCFDSDDAGQNAAVRSLDHLLASGLAVRVAVVPKPHDPDSYIKEAGPEKFRELIKNAQGFFDYYLGRLVSTNDLTTDKGRLAVLHAMAEAVLKTGNDVLTDKYAQLTALRLGVSPESVRGEFRKAARNLRRAQPDLETPQPEPEGAGTEAAPEISPPSPQEFWLLKLLLSYDDLVPWAAMHLDLEWLQHPHVTQIIGARLRECQEETWTSLPAFLAKFEDPGIASLITEATIDARLLPNPPQQLADVTLRIRNQFLDRRLAALLHQASQPETSDADREALLREQVRLRASKQERLPIPEPGV
jgi:DNA primase